MDFFKNQAMNLVGVLLSQLLSMATPAIRKALEDFLKQLYVKAKATPNGFDDALVGVLLALVGIDTPTPLFSTDELMATPGGETVEHFRGVTNMVKEGEEMKPKKKC